MSSRSLVVSVLLFLALPAAVLLVAYRIRPPAFIWQEDPIVLLISRTPVGMFPGTTRVEALNNRLNAFYKDGATLTLINLDDPSAAERELGREVQKLREGGVEVSGSAPDFRYTMSEPMDRLGRIIRAENTVVHVTGLTASSLRYHFLSTPLLLDQSDQSLGRRLFSEYRRTTIGCLVAYLALGALLGTRVFSARHHGRRPGLPE